MFSYGVGLSHARTAIIVLLLTHGDTNPTTAKQVGGCDPPGLERSVRRILARFDQGDPSWKVRMQSLAEVVSAGPGATAALVQGLQNGPPATREFSAQALVFVADPSARPALVQALDDPDPHVHIYAIKALNMLGRLELTQSQREHLKKTAPYWMREYIDFVSQRNETPKPGAMRAALTDYDLAKMDSARVGHMAADFVLRDGAGAVYHLSQFRGKKAVILEFSSGDG
ncbi:MAG: HEAT repeat domain-containing protein [Candidatus Omnitrophica bacterium]|nr:HEAT repeat domain-containing protein [Candidatus Omnitrophota bacterium]